MKNEVDLSSVSSLNDLKACLFVNLPNAQKILFSAGDGFDRSKYFYRLLGNPQNGPKTIHLAGTSGKGSTAYYLSALLIEHGFRVGTHVSPHIFDIRETAMVNLELSDERDYLSTFKKIWKNIDEMRETKYGLPTYFEVVVGLAFTLFRDKKVDYSVIETGLGGKYDSTNNIEGPNKLSVITRIGLDHTEVLGDTIEKIAWQKAGIINKNSKVICVEQEKDVNSVFKQASEEQNAELKFVNPKKLYGNSKLYKSQIVSDFAYKDLTINNCKLASFATYQQENASLAISILQELSIRDGFNIKPELVKNALLKTLIPGRCEIRKIKNQTYVLDGAHNPQKMAGFVESISSLRLGTKPIWLIGMKKDKDIRGVIEQITPLADKIVCTEFFRNSSNKHLNKFASASDFLANEVKMIEKDFDVQSVPDSYKALQLSKSLASDGQLIIISGSLYLLGEINQYLHN